MNGLHVFVPLGDADHRSNTFYSQRSNGPFYRWRYEKSEACWRVARMHAHDRLLLTLDQAPWKSLPQDLKEQLSEHYVE